MMASSPLPFFASTPARLLSSPTQPLPYSLAPPKQDEFYSFPFFHFNLNHYRITMRPSHSCRPLHCPHPTHLVARRPFPCACHSCFVCHRPYYHLAARKFN